MMGCETIDGFWIDAGIMHAGHLEESYSIASTVIYLEYPDTFMWLFLIRPVTIY